MKRSKIIKELEGQKKHINQALGHIDRHTQTIFENVEDIDGYWYGRLVTIEDTLRLLTEGLNDGPT